MQQWCAGGVDGRVVQVDNSCTLVAQFVEGMTIDFDQQYDTSAPYILLPTLLFENIEDTNS